MANHPQLGSVQAQVAQTAQQLNAQIVQRALHAGFPPWAAAQSLRCTFHPAVHELQLLCVAGLPKPSPPYLLFQIVQLCPDLLLCDPLTRLQARAVDYGRPRAAMTDFVEQRGRASGSGRKHT